MTPALVLFRRLGFLAGLLLAWPLRAEPVDFDLPASPSAAESLLAFSRLARVEVLFPFDELRAVPAAAVSGRLEAEVALARLLRNTGFTARRSLRGKFIVARATHPTGTIEGRILTPAGAPAAGLPVALAGSRLRTVTDGAGRFLFPAVPPGPRRIFAGAAGFRLLERSGLEVAAGRTLELGDLQLEPASDITVLDPYVVTERTDRLPIGGGVGAPPRRAAGNLDLPRTQDNALPFTLFTREQIARSGVVQLNEFLQRELIESSATQPPEQSTGSASYATGSSNLKMRGYAQADETVVLVNGRRLPETITGEAVGFLGPPDVNLIPLSLVQQVEVLPVSASALYSGNAVGGVINIVLSPGADATELRTTYTNALGGFDAPQSSVSLQHGRTLLDGRLRLLFNATQTHSTPVVEGELGYQQARLARSGPGFQARATPNVAGADGAPLFASGATFTSVAPGADGHGGLAAFAGREGLYSTGRFDAPGGLATHPDSRDYVYGREQHRSSFFGSAVFDLHPNLQLGLDASHGRTVVNRGYEVFPAQLRLDAGSPLNPFGREAWVALYETTPALGQNYNEARVESWSVVGGALLKLPADWRLTLDAQLARNTARYRGLIRADADRWQELVDAGLYQPLRDTQVHGPPREFYERVLVHHGTPGRFVTLGDYTTLEGAARLTHESLALPTGEGTFNLGADYRFRRLAPYTEAPRYADGTPAGDIVRWSGRTLERISVFGEIQAPLVPAARLPRWIQSVETDTAVRYVLSANAHERNFAPTFGLKVDFRGGLALRGSYTTSNRFPTPVMSRPVSEGSGGSGIDLVNIIDPRRGGEEYLAESKVVINPDIRPESAVTQTAGLVFSRGGTHRLRASVDFADTTKTNEFIGLDATGLMNLEAAFPDRVLRHPPEGTRPGRVRTLLTGALNAARRHSQNVNTALEYAWPDFAGGTLELRGRWVWFLRYDRKLFATDPVVDQLDAPDGTAPGLLRHRLTFGASWSSDDWGFGVDGHYLGARRLPVSEWAAQGGRQIEPYWQFDVFTRTDLTRWLPRRSGKFRLEAQLRVNNLSGFDFPRYVPDPSGAGVQPYGDWRGRTYSLSLTASF